MSLPLNILSVSGASILGVNVLRHIWDYLRKNGLQGRISVEWEIGSARQTRPRSQAK